MVSRRPSRFYTVAVVITSVFLALLAGRLTRVPSVQVVFGSKKYSLGLELLILLAYDYA